MRVVVVGAGFGGLELSSCLSEELGDDVEVMLIDRSDHFVFGYSKLDVMFGRENPASVRCAYRGIVKPGVAFRQETVVVIDPEVKRVVTDRGRYDADVLVVALGADLDVAATPGLAEAGYDFYSPAGAEQARDVVRRFDTGTAVIGVMGPFFKCPPAPSEAALMLHDELQRRGVRDATRIKLVSPLASPVPVSPDTSQALLAAFAERDIEFIGSAAVDSVDPAGKALVLDDGGRIDFDLLLAVPVHVAPEVVRTSALARDGWIAVDAHTLATPFADVYAIGDVTSAPVPRAVCSPRVRRASSPAASPTASGDQPTLTATRAPAVATSSSAPALSRGSTSTSSVGRNRRAGSPRRRSTSPPRRPTSAPVGAAAGSTPDAGLRSRRRCRFGVSFTEAQLVSGAEYNFRPLEIDPETLPGGGKGTEPVDDGEPPGMSAFALEDGVVYHTYSAHARGCDALWGMCPWLDRAPLGRNEDCIWWRRHDEYEH